MTGQDKPRCETPDRADVEDRALDHLLRQTDSGRIDDAHRRATLTAILDRARAEAASNEAGADVGPVTEAGTIIRLSEHRQPRAAQRSTTAERGSTTSGHRVTTRVSAVSTPAAALLAACLVLGLVAGIANQHVPVVGEVVASLASNGAQGVDGVTDALASEGDDGLL